MTINKRNRQYIKEFKKSTLSRLGQNQKVGSLSQELNISKFTYINGKNKVSGQ